MPKHFYGGQRDDCNIVFQLNVNAQFLLQKWFEDLIKLLGYISRALEKEFGTSFAKTDLNTIKKKLPRLLVENLEIAEDVQIKAENNIATVEITNHVFSQVCDETRKLEKVHTTVGCVLSSALACVLAKATGKPVTIEKEEVNKETKTTKIQFHMIEEH